jgi:hypothetical protein
LSKNTRLIALAGLCLLCILAIAVLNGGNESDDVRKAMNERLVGTNLTYYSIAGEPMNYTIMAGDIVSVEKAEYNGQPAWKVRVGQGIAWDLTMDAECKQILDTKQLFVT